MPYLIHIAILFTIYAVLSVSLNLVVGYTGLLSVTHAAFFGIGAYAVAVLTTVFHFNFFAALGMGVAISAILAIFIGAVLSRLGGDYYVLGTVGFNVIVASVFLNWNSLTRGPLGIPGVPRPYFLSFIFSDNLNFLLLCAAVLLLIYWGSRLLADSSFGRVLKAIREDENALRVFGYATTRYKLTVFALAAAAAAVAGGLLATYITFVDPTGFYVMESVFILSMVILGGFANLRGSLLGALFLVILPEALRFVGFPDMVAGQMRQAIYGLLLVLLMLYRPQGLLGEYKF